MTSRLSHKDAVCYKIKGPTRKETAIKNLADKVYVMKVRADIFFPPL